MTDQSPDHPNTEQAFANFDLRAEAPEARKPAVRFAFENQALLDLFEPADEAAGKARRVSRVAGVFAVLIVMAALMLASLGPLLYEQGHVEAGTWGSLHALVGLFAAVLGLAGTALGLMGSSRGASRRRWLQARLKTETLRLFHFHYIAARLPEIVAVSGDETRKSHYLEARALALERLKAKVLADPEAELKRIIARHDETTFQSITPFEQATDDIVPAAALDVFAVWRVLRLDWQANYCAAKLEHKRPDTMTPKAMEEMFERFAWFFVGAIIIIHVAHFIGALAQIRFAWLEVAVIWAALAALATRALEDGFQPMREVERYEQYRANVRVARERFEAATTFPAKLEAMRAFERTSLEEMRVFLRTHARARFLL